MNFADDSSVNHFRVYITFPRNRIPEIKSFVQEVLNVTKRDENITKILDQISPNYSVVEIFNI